MKVRTFNASTQCINEWISTFPHVTKIALSHKNPGSLKEMCWKMWGGQTPEGHSLDEVNWDKLFVHLQSKL